MFKFAGLGLGAMIVGVVMNLAFWGGLIYFTLWALREFNII